MPHMPKHMTKGPYFAKLGANHSPPVASTAPDQRAYLLAELRNGIHLAEIMTIGQVGGAAGKGHLRQDWFGEGVVNANGQTGWWRNWKGEPEKVLRCGLIRALEVAMGLSHNCPHHTPGLAPAGTTADPAQRPPGGRNLPIDYYWVCGPSRFEVYVNWNSRQVTVILVTPGFPFALVEDPDENGGALDDWTRPPNDTGTIFIGQAEDLPSPADPPALKQLKKKVTVMKDGVITHRLNEARGGSGAP